MSDDKTIDYWTEEVLYSQCPCGHMEEHGPGCVITPEPEETCSKCGKTYPINDLTDG